MDEELILVLTDDDEDEHLIFESALKILNQKVKLKSYYDVLSLLNELNVIEPPPGVLFLDINMPAVDGLQALSQIKNNDKFDRMPVIIYSTSDNYRDKVNAYKLGADLYLKKLNSISSLSTKLNKIIECVKDGKPFSMEEFQSPAF